MDEFGNSFGSRVEWLYKRGYIARPETEKVSQNAFYSMKRPDANPTLEKILALREVNHLLNFHWLITGDGNPFNINPNDQPLSDIEKKTYTYVFGEGNVTAAAESEATYQRHHDSRELQLLKEEVQQLKKLLEQKDKMIELLQKQLEKSLS